MQFCIALAGHVHVNDAAQCMLQALMLMQALISQCPAGAACASETFYLPLDFAVPGFFLCGLI